MHEDLKSRAVTVVEAFAKAYNRHHEGSFEFPISVKFSCKGKLMGQAISSIESRDGKSIILSQLVELNMGELLKDPKAYFNMVIPHEVAHLYTHQVACKLRMNVAKLPPHGKLWQESMRKIKQDPKVFYNHRHDGFV